MTYEQARRLIREHVEANWPGSVPLLVPNREDDIGEASEFARLSIQPSAGRQVAVGSREHRRQGVVIMQLFVAQGTGDATLGALEELATGLFHQEQLNGITFRDVGADHVGPDGRGYFQSNVRATFEFDT